MIQRSCSLRRTVDRCAAGSARRGGMTLVEMLVAMALSLIIILAVTQVFRIVGDNVLASRAVTEMSGQLRTVADQLRRDLDGVTVPALPWADTVSGAGYLEVCEGPFWDLGLGPDAALAPPDPPADPLVPRPIPWFPDTSVGDCDDVLLLTCRAKGTPFVGQVLGTVTAVQADPAHRNPARLVVSYEPGSSVRTTIESNIAEIAWFTRFDDRNANAQPDPGEVTLHRRVFLVLPHLDLSDADIQALTPGEFYQGFDVSVRYEGTSAVSGAWPKFANSLESLARRENRTGHFVAGGYLVPPAGSLATHAFPYPLSRALLTPQGTLIAADGLTRRIDSEFPASPLAVTLGESFGNDVVLSQLLAFDVKVFDPTVAVHQAAATSPAGVTTVDSVLPGDPGYRFNGTTVGSGGYVDLFYARYVLGASADPSVPPLSTFAAAPNLKLRPQLWLWPPNDFASVYDTWSMFYEHDGVNQDGDDIIDEGTNGFDDNGIDGVDDPGERETSPPYPVPLRSLQVRLRIIDPDSRQVRQVTVSSDFIPE